MLKDLEHHEHAEQIAHGHGEHGSPDGHDAGGGFNTQLAALLVAILAAGLAITDQGARRAEIRVQQLAIYATDAWAQYQAKSIRGTFSKDLTELTAALGPADPASMALREKLIEQMKKDQERYEKDPKDGKEAISERARRFEEDRDHALEQTHAYHNGAAALELGIVLTTASAITKSRMLITFALGLGIIGIILAVLGVFVPEYGALRF
jgi:hypothetical protein